MAGEWLAALAALACAVASVAAAAPPVEYNPVRSAPLRIGPEAHRLVVGFRTTADNAVVQTIRSQLHGRELESVQAGTSARDVADVALRAHLKLARSRQITPSMHVLYLDHALYGAAVGTTLELLRADSTVAFADVDERRYPHSLPDDPLFPPTANASGQWYLLTPSPTGDASATDAVSAWNLTTGSSGIVIADVDTGIRFEHPDLLRAGFGGRLLPGYDFVGGDLNSAGAALGSFLIANDGDGWDPDPSDPGDWINQADQTNALFPAATCTIADSSWHGTRVMGILGAITNNDTGIAATTWQPYLLPVRALGKCGGYDSDIITAMQWAAGLSITGVPNNPYPADIINLSLGGAGACPADYASAVTTLTGMGVLIVASAGNGSKAPAVAAVDAPANCPGVLGVAGLRNVGTKVGYSSLGPQVGVAAPAGNCVVTSGPCLKSIDTTSNTGLTLPADSTYTNSLNVNLGTSFSAPIVSSIAALMRSVNANLTPAQLIARIRSSATAFPQPAGVPVCPAADPTSGECACPNDGSECGAGMVNAFAAVTSALKPIAAVVIPANARNGSTAIIDASGSAAACGATLASYAWTATGATIQPGTESSPEVTVIPTGTAGTITLVVTDSVGMTDTAIVTVQSSGALASGSAIPPASAGARSSACPVPLTVTTVPPTVSETFTPAKVGVNVASTLTLTLGNANAFDLTQASLTEVLPANLVTASSMTATQSAPATTCSGGTSALTTAPGSVTLNNAIIPAHGSCVITLPVQSAVAGNYVNTVAANALQTGPAGGNATSVSETLVVAVPGKGGGGQLDWWDTLFAVGVLLAGRRHVKRRPPANPIRRSGRRRQM